MRSPIVVASGLAGVAFAFSLSQTASAQEWVDITPPSLPAPSIRSLASAVLIPQERKMVVFGGQNASGPLNDIWEFDLDTHTWMNLTPVGPAPSPRFTPVSVYDPAGHRLITWSGQGSGAVFFNDVWSFDLTTHAWTMETPTGGPPEIRYGAAGVFDPQGGDLVTFAGFTDMGRFDDVWRYNRGGDTWTDVSPGTGPLERCLHSAAYDSRDHRMIMFGGQNAGPLNDIWAFDLDLDQWTQLMPPSSPSGRFFASHVYDAANHRSTVFGGNLGGGMMSNQAWVFDLSATSWHLLMAAGTLPSAREGAAAVYDGPQDRMIIFGGRDTSYRNDVWALTSLSGTVTGVGGSPAATAADLHQNRPNPFNPVTTIAFDTPATGHVSLAIFDLHGQPIRVLTNGVRPAGRQEVVWDGRSDAGLPVASGVYLYRLQYNGESMSRKLALLR